MPASVALIKLKGYVHDAQGDVISSEPGLVKVKLPGGDSIAPRGRLSWLGINRKPGPIVLELHMQQSEGRESLLQIAARFRPGDTTPATDLHWRARCVAQFINLRGYMIGATASVV
jgi:serine/threonine-protein kinase